MLDVYDLVYEEVRRNGSSSKRHELTLIHEVVSYLPDLREAFFFLEHLPIDSNRLCFTSALVLFSSRTSLLPSLYVV